MRVYASLLLFEGLQLGLHPPQRLSLRLQQVRQVQRPGLLLLKGAPVTIETRCDNCSNRIWKPWQPDMATLATRCGNHGNQMWQPWQPDMATMEPDVATMEPDMATMATRYGNSSNQMWQL